MPSKKFPWLIVCVIVLLAVILSLGFVRVINQLSSASSHVQTTTQATATPTPVIPSPTPTPTLPLLRVSGTQIINASGQTVTLLGASHSSLGSSAPRTPHLTTSGLLISRRCGPGA